MATWMLYATFVAVLIGAAAWALELALHPMRLPLRWIWAAALAGSCAFAVLPLFGKAPPLEAAATVVPSAPAAPIVADTPTLLDSGLPAHPGVFDRLRGVRASLPTLPARFDIWVVIAWLSLSLFAAAIWMRASVKLHEARRTWGRERVDGRAVLISDEVGPAVVGALRPAIVVPRWALTASRADRELMLRHEEEHLRAHDPQLLAGSLLIVALLPWNAPLWWLVHRLRMAVELDCDRRVLRCTPELRRYATLLVEMSRRGAISRLGALALAHPAPLLERRIRTMTARKQPNRVRTASFALAAALFAVAAARVEAPARSALPQTPSGPAARALAERLPPFMDATAVARPVSSMADPTAEPASEVPLDRDGDAVESRAMAPIQLGVGPSQPARLGRITGLVTDFHSGAPLSNVQIFVVGGYQGTLTRMNGQFDIPDVPAGTYELRALRIGLTTQTQQLTVTAEGAVEANFQLSAQAIGLDEIRSDGILLREAPPAVAPTPAPPRDVPGPVFTPFVVRPAVTNPSDVAAALNNAYPPTLRTAGIGGTAEIWFYVDAEGVTQNMKLNKGSGNEQLDEAAMSAARAAEFSPGMNRDQAVAVWVSMPLTFRP